MIRQFFRRYRITETADTENLLWLALMMRLG